MKFDQISAFTAHRHQKKLFSASTEIPRQLIIDRPSFENSMARVRNQDESRRILAQLISSHVARHGSRSGSFVGWLVFPKSGL